MSAAVTRRVTTGWGVRRTMRRALVGVVAVAVATMGLTPIAASAAASNPPLQPGCGLDVVLVLDASESIRTANAGAAVRSTAMTILGALENTNTQLGIVQFNTTATQTLPLTPVTTASVTGAGSHATAVRNYRAGAATIPGGQTNWEDALLKAQTEFGAARVPAVPKLLIFITDGAPNTYNSAGGTTPTTDADPVAVAHAVAVMDGMKAAGVHALAVGTGKVYTDPVGQGRFTQALIDVSGPNLAGPDLAPPVAFDASTTDVLLSQNTAAIGAQLRQLSVQVCKGSLTVTRLVGSRAGSAAYGAAGPAFNLTTTVSPGGDWVTPTVGAGPAEASLTNVGGTAQFAWSQTTTTAWTKAATVAITPQAHYTPAAKGAVTCLRNGVAITPPAVTGWTFHVPVSGNTTVACTVRLSWTGPLNSVLKVTPSVRTAVYGSRTFSLATVLRNADNKPLANRIVRLLSRSPHGVKWTLVKVGHTDRNGFFRTFVLPTSNRVYQATYGGQTGLLFRGASPLVAVNVAQKVTLTVKSHSVARGKSLQFAGAVAPNERRQIVLLQRRVGTTWVTVKRGRLSSKSRFAISWKVSTRSSTLWRVLRAADSARVAGASHAIRTTVR